MDVEYIECDVIDEVDEALAELLASLVKSHPCIYDKTCAEYKDKSFVMNTWTTIAATCNTSVEFVQKQWKTIRGQFTREHRRQKEYEPSGSGNYTLKRPRKTWYLYESLLYLIPHIAHRRTCSNFIRKNTPLLPSSSQSQSFSVSPMPSTSKGVSIASLDSNIYDSDISIFDTSIASSAETPPASPAINKKNRNLLCPPPDASVQRKKKEYSQQQEMLYKSIDNTNTVLKSAIDKFSDNSAKPKDNENDDELIAKCLINALKDVQKKFKMQCFIDCLTTIKNFQNMEYIEDL